MIFQYTKRVNSKVLTNLKNLIDFYNIGPVKKSMFGYYFDSIKFFYQLKNQGHNYIYDEVSSHLAFEFLYI